MYRIRLHRRAATYLKKLPHKDQLRVKEALDRLRSDPAHQPGVKSMVGGWAGYHRMRVGGVRAIFLVDEASSTVLVDHIGPRGDVYKR